MPPYTQVDVCTHPKESGSSKFHENSEDDSEEDAETELSDTLGHWDSKDHPIAHSISVADMITYIKQSDRYSPSITPCTKVDMSKLRSLIRLLKQGHRRTNKKGVTPSVEPTMGDEVYIDDQQAFSLD